jgi:hypothetical protein
VAEDTRETVTGRDRNELTAALKKRSGRERDELTAVLKERYEAGESIRALAAATGRSYGFVHRILTEAGVNLRGRGGATRARKRASAEERAAVQHARAAKAQPVRHTGAELRAALADIAPPDDRFAEDIAAALTLLTVEENDPWAGA